MKNLNIIILSAVSLLFAGAPQCLAFGGGMTEAEREAFWKSAYGYRFDVSPEVMAMVESWKSPAVFHSDRIGVTRFGREIKCISLEGKPILQGEDFDTVISEPVFGYYQVAKDPELNKTGIVKADGTEIVPIEFSMIIFNKLEGTFECSRQNEYGKWVKSIYTIEGYHLFTGDERAENSYVSTHYNKDWRIFLFSHNGRYEVTTVEGDRILGPETYKKDKSPLLSHGNTPALVFKKGSNWVDVPIKGYTKPSDYPQRKYNQKEIEFLEEERFYGNYWINLAIMFYEDQRYDQVVKCLSFYDAFDYSSCINRECQMLVISMLMDSARETGDYDLLYKMNFIDYTKYGIYCTDPRDSGFASRGLEFRPIFNPGNERMKQMWATCESVWNEVIKPHWEQRDAERKARIAAEEQQRRQRNAAIWEAVLLGVAQTAASFASSPAPAPQQSYSQPAAAAAAAAPSSSASYSSSSSSSRTVRTKTCPVCKGTGREPKNTYMGSATAGKKKWCDICQEEKPYGHHHVHCSTCHGTGVIEY